MRSPAPGSSPRGRLPASILPGQEDQVAVEFRPIGDGPVSDTFTIESNSASRPPASALTGVGVMEALLTAKPASLEFGTVPVGSESPGRECVVANAGVRPVILQGFAFSGPDAADYAIAANDRAPGDMLLPEQTCTLTVVFGGTAPGPRSAMLEIAHDWPNSPFRLPVEGLAVDPKGIVPLVSEIDFGDVQVGTTSKRRTVTLTNKSGDGRHHRGRRGHGQGPRRLQARQGRVLRLDPPARGQVLAAGRRGPGRHGQKEAELTVKADVPADAVPLRANGLDISVQWSTALLDFATWKVGQTS